MAKAAPRKRTPTPKPEMIDVGSEVPVPPTDDEVLTPDEVTTDSEPYVFTDSEGIEQVVAQDNLPVQTSPEKRRLQALSLRLSGASYKVIAQALRVSVDTAKRDVQSAFAEMGTDDVRSMRAIHHQRLELLLMRQWKGAMEGDIAATNTSLGIMDRIANLFGINDSAPTEEDSESESFIILGNTSSEDYIAMLTRARSQLKKGQGG